MARMVWSKKYHQELSRENTKVEQNADFHMELPKKSAWEKMANCTLIPRYCNSMAVLYSQIPFYSKGQEQTDHGHRRLSLECPPD